MVVESEPVHEEVSIKLLSRGIYYIQKDRRCTGMVPVRPVYMWHPICRAHTGHVAYHNGLPSPLEHFHCQLTRGGALIHKRWQGCGVIVAGITVGILAGVTVFRIVILLLLLSMLFLQVVVADLCWELLFSALF
jgi:hypothetical protein